MCAADARSVCDSYVLAYVCDGSWGGCVIDTVCVFVGVSVSRITPKVISLILLKINVIIGPTIGKNRFAFDGDLVLDTDSGSVLHFLSIAE